MASTRELWEEVKVPVLCSQTKSVEIVLKRVDKCQVTALGLQCADLGVSKRTVDNNNLDSGEQSLLKNSEGLQVGKSPAQRGESLLIHHFILS